MRDHETHSKDFISHRRGHLVLAFQLGIPVAERNNGEGEYGPISLLARCVVFNLKVSTVLL